MSNLVKLPNGTVIEKGTDGTWHIKSWVTGEVRDKDGQVIEVDELIADVAKMMEDKPKAHLGHTDTPLGPITDVRKAKRDYKGKQIDAIQASWDLAGDRRYKLWVQKEMEKGNYPELSIKAFAFDKEYKNDSEGVLSEFPKDLEWTGFALCRKGKNPTTGHIDINGVSIEKSDEATLTKSAEFNAIVTRLMKDDGLSYTQAMEAAKDLYSDDIAKAMLEIEKGEIEMPNELEAIKKELADYKVASEERTASLEKSNTEIKAELEKEKVRSEGLKTDLEKMSTESKKTKELGMEIDKEDKPEILTKEDVEKMLILKKEEVKAEFMQDLMKDGEEKDKFLKGMGLLKASETPEGMATLLKSEPTDEDLKALGELVAKAQNVHQNSNIDSIKSYEDLEKEAKGEPLKEGE